MLRRFLRILSKFILLYTASTKLHFNWCLFCSIRILNYFWQTIRILITDIICVGHFWFGLSTLVFVFSLFLSLNLNFLCKLALSDRIQGCITITINVHSCLALLSFVIFFCIMTKSVNIRSGHRIGYFLFFFLPRHHFTDTVHLRFLNKLWTLVAKLFGPDTTWCHV